MGFKDIVFIVELLGPILVAVLVGMLKRWTSLGNDGAPYVTVVIAVVCGVVVWRFMPGTNPKDAILAFMAALGAGTAYGLKKQIIDK